MADTMPAMGAAFFSIDGLDGTGKSTQCRLLADVLRRMGRSVVTCVDPGGTPLGQDLRALLLQGQHSISLASEALLFMASRAQLVADVIRPALSSGQSVVSDRYLLANVVYQGHAGGLDVDALWSIGEMATGGVHPDLTFILDVPLEVTLKRRKPKADRMESRGEEFFAKVRAGFLAEAARRPDRLRVVDATAGIDAIHKAIAHEVQSWLRTRSADESS